MAVIVSHAIGRANRDPSTRWQGSFDHPEWVILGHFGVDLFFVLSGFLMYAVHYKDFGLANSPFRFLIKRLIRIVPIYWLLTTVALGVLLVAPNLFSFRSNAEIHWVIGSFLFIPTVTSYGVDSPLLGVGWTLNYEIHFYAAFALCLFFRRKIGVAILFSLFGVLVLYGALFKVNQHSPWINLLTSPMLLEFLLGIVVGMVSEKFSNRIASWRAVFLVIGIAIILSSGIEIPRSHEERIWTWGLGSGMLLLGAVLSPIAAKGPLVRGLSKLGDASYSAYLLQVFTLPALFYAVLWSGATEYLGHTGTVLVMVAGTWIISLAFFHSVEKPLNRVLRRLLVLEHNQPRS